MRCRYLTSAVVVLTALVCVVLLFTCASAQSISPDEARAIAREAYTYGYPLVESYGVIYSYFVDSSSPQFKAPWNQLRNSSASANTSQTGSAADAQTSQPGADLRLDESNPMAEDVTYRISLADSGSHRLNEANDFAQRSLDEQVLPIHTPPSLGIFEPTFSFFNHSPYNPYGIDGP